MPIITEFQLIKVQRYAKRNNLSESDVQNLYQSGFGKEINLPESELTNEEKAEDLAYDILAKFEMGLVNDDNLNDLSAMVQEAFRLSPASLPVLEAASLFVGDASFVLEGVHLGEERFEKDEKYKDNFWEYPETRPYMRLLARKADMFVKAKMYSEAIECYEKLMDLNRIDPCGVRFELQTLFLEREEFDKFMDLLDEFPNDFSVHSVFNYALYSYILEGESDDVNKIMRDAVTFNPFVLPYLQGKKKAIQTAPFFNPMDETGAIEYCLTALHLWHKQYGIQKWLKKFQVL